MFGVGSDDAAVPHFSFGGSPAFFPGSLCCRATTGPPAATHALLDVLDVVLRALAPWPRALLPAAYPLWPPLLELIGGADRSVAAHAMRVFAAAARATRGEVSARVVGDAIGQLVRALRAHATVAAPTRADMAALASVVAPAATRAAGAAGAPDAPDATLAADSAHGAAAPPPPAAPADGGRGRSAEALLGACGCLRALCNTPRAMRPKLLDVLRAASPLLRRHQPARLQAGALRLCRALARLDPDAVWLFFVGFVPPAERWPARAPAGCARPLPSTLLEPPAGAAYVGTAAAEGDIAPAHARRVLEAVYAADRRVARRALSNPAACARGSAPVQ